MCKKSLALLAIVVFIFLTHSRVLADEGMWPLYDLDKLPFDSLRERGLMLESKQIYNPEGGGIADAVVRVGATGSFVSPEGLIITNHHVAFGAIQKQSSVETNLVRDGFYAASQEEEIPAIGYNVYVTRAIEDVTDRVVASVNDEMSDFERYQAIDKITKEIIKEAEEGRDVRCRVAKMLGGTQFILYTYFKIRDVRIVYVPPISIGEYGGDIDNWMWPRHTGDFSFLRAYVAPDGSSAEYSEENILYHPKVYLPVSSAGVKEGDFTMMMGFPGGTSRYTSSYSLDNLVNHSYPRLIPRLEDILTILEEASAQDSSVAIRLVSYIKGLNNFLKNSYAMSEGFKKSDILHNKKEDERELAEFLKTEPELEKKYGHVLPELERLYAEKLLTHQKDFALARSGSDLLEMAIEIHKWSIEREKDDMERERGFQDRDSASTREWLENAQINLIPSVDKELFKYNLARALELPADQKIKAIEDIFEGKTGAERDEYLNRYTDSLFDNTNIDDLDQRLKMFGMARDELEKLGDAMINLAMALRPELDDLRKRSKKHSGAQSRLGPKLIAAYAEWKKEKMYPDANGTMRFNYGSVAGYSPRDAVNYDYITSLKGVMEKETGEDPFIVPDELKQAYADRDYGSYADLVCDDIPVNFLTTNDGTGGNSGSPVLNGKGELIGLDFDGNYEAVVADYIFDAAIGRSIVVDIRYVLFLIDKVYHLDGLVQELTIH